MIERPNVRFDMEGFRQNIYSIVHIEPVLSGERCSSRGESTRKGDRRGSARWRQMSLILQAWKFARLTTAALRSGAIAKSYQQSLLAVPGTEGKPASPVAVAKLKSAFHR